MILKEIFHAVQELVDCTVIDIPSQKAFEVIDIVEATEKMGIKVD